MLPALRMDGQDRSDAAHKAEELRDYIRANYTKSEYMASMRDGVRLFISVYAPKDTSRRYPIWMTRTPYTVAPYGADNYRAALGPSEFFARAGYIFAYCDVRGLGKSKGNSSTSGPTFPTRPRRGRRMRPRTRTTPSTSC